MDYPCLQHVLSRYLPWHQYSVGNIYEVKAILKRALRNKEIDAIREEIEFSLTDKYFDWKRIGRITGFVKPDFQKLGILDTYISNEDIFDGFKLVMWDLLYPENEHDEIECEKFWRSVYYVLRDIALTHDDCVSTEFVINCLHEIGEEYHTFERYNLRDIRSRSRYFRQMIVDYGAPNLPYAASYPVFSIKSLKIYGGYMNPDIELTPNLLIDDFTTDEIDKGIHLTDFVWPHERTKDVQRMYKKYKQL